MNLQLSWAGAVRFLACCAWAALTDSTSSFAACVSGFAAASASASGPAAEPYSVASEVRLELMEKRRHGGSFCFPSQNSLGMLAIQSTPRSPAHGQIGQ